MNRGEKIRAKKIALYQSFADRLWEINEENGRITEKASEPIRIGGILPVKPVGNGWYMII